MKSIFYSHGLAFLILLFSLISSCKKEKLDAGYITPVPSSSSGANNNNSLKTLDTLYLTVTQWVFNEDRGFTADISNQISDLVKTPFEIDQVNTKVNDQIECICGKIDYKSGKLWATYSLNQCLISYEAPFGEMPFHRLDLIILLSK